jgi:hypothetical protein
MSRAGALPALLCLALKSMLWEWAQDDFKKCRRRVLSCRNLSPVFQRPGELKHQPVAGAEPREGENGILPSLAVSAG